jgi:spermidine synthase
MIENKLQRPVALLLFFFSGFVSLIFQVVWLKMLVLVFGNTVWASSTLLTAFMAGLAIGSWLFGRIADKTKSSLRLYGIIEGIIGVYAILTPLIFSKLHIIYAPINSITGGNDLILGMFKFLIGFIILLPPTICMGGTLPLLAKCFTKNIDKAGSKIGSLYTINTFGAVVGTFIAGFFLIPVFGLKTTIFIGSIINLIILLISFIITKGEKAGFSKYGLKRSKETG